MSVTYGSNLGLMLTQTQGDTPWNEPIEDAFALLDVIVHLDVIQRSLNTPPGGPTNGDRYHIGASPTGAWASNAGDIAVRQAGAWVFIEPKEGWLITSQADPNCIYKYQSGAFVLAGRSNADFKDSVRVATTANGTLASAFANGQTVDGVTLATGDRILLKNQSSASENGIYTVNASGAPTRAKDFDEDAEVTAGCIIPVEAGTANGDKLFMLTTNNPITVGSTGLTFSAYGASSVSALDDLSDVVITSAATGKQIRHNGSSWVDAFERVILTFAITDETTDLTTGTAKLTIRMPFAMTLTAVRANVNTVSSSGNPTVDINKNGSTTLSTKLSIDSGEKTSVTAASAAVISDANWADDDEITFDIDTAGTGAKGLKVTLYGTRTD